MSPKRAPSPPPEIPGFDFQRLLGSGGFADVFLFQQTMPSRPVAVKVLLPDAVDRDLIEDFRHEANIMAQLSTHPSIVTVYGAAVTADGRPYLAMEFCPRPNLGSRYRRERFSVPEVLQLGVQIAGAVETAHRAGVLHRDIKPANILVTAYNRPALTDFGIATTDRRAGGEGMSIPWSPPESFDTPPRSGRESDVFSLAATLSTLLAGRTPFELPGMGNSSIDLIDRIQRGQIAPLARADVPPALEAVLVQAMAPDPRRRHGSALEFGRALQQVEVDLRLPATPMDVLDEALPADEVEEDDDGATRVRGIVQIDPEGPAGSADEGVDDATLVRTSGGAPRLGAVHLMPGMAPPAPLGSPSLGAPPIGAPPLGAAPLGAPAAGAPGATALGAPSPGAAPSRRRGWAVAAVSGGILLTVVLAIAFLSTRTGEPMAADPSESHSIAQQQSPPQQPIVVEASVEGDEAVFEFANPQQQDGDSLRYRVDASNATTESHRTTETRIAVPLDTDGETCIEVAVERRSGQASAFTRACVEG